jgi:hypothetical protein
MFNGLTINECITWLNDVPRNSWYRDKIKKLVKNKVVFEVGCGSGILAAYCLEFGAKHYYGIDIRSHRVDYTKKILDQLGYHKKHTVITGNFLEIKSFENKIDLLLVEQTGNQYQNNFMIKQIWQHACKLFPYNFVSLPDQWNLDIWIYEGTVNAKLEEHKASKLIDDSSLPTNYYQSVLNLNLLHPVKELKQALTINLQNCTEKIYTEIQTSDMNNITLLLDDYISFKGNKCNSASAVSDWPIPVLLNHNCSKDSIFLRWDPMISDSPNFHRGFWKID